MGSGGLSTGVGLGSTVVSLGMELYMSFTMSIIIVVLSDIPILLSIIHIAASFLFCFKAQLRNPIRYQAVVVAIVIVVWEYMAM